MKQLTATEYQDARVAINAYNRASSEYCKANRTNGIPSEVCATFPYSDKVTNELRSACEVYEFVNHYPLTYFLYISEARAEATTWTGDKLGAVVFGREYRDNFGGKRVPITVHAINGCKYFGTYYKSSGDYARVKMAKKPK